MTILFIKCVFSVPNVRVRKNTWQNLQAAVSKLKWFEVTRV